MKKILLLALLALTLSLGASSCKKDPPPVDGTETTAVTSSDATVRTEETSTTAEPDQPSTEAKETTVTDPLVTTQASTAPETTTEAETTTKVETTTEAEVTTDVETTTVETTATETTEPTTTKPVEIKPDPEEIRTEWDMTTLSGQPGYMPAWDAAGYSTPLIKLGYTQFVDLGEIDLSEYSTVYITYGCDGSDITKNVFASSPSLAIGLKSTASTYGQEADVNMDGDIAHTDMVFKDKNWAAGAREAVIDLSGVTYKGHVYAAVHNPVGTEIAISKIVFAKKVLTPQAVPEGIKNAFNNRTGEKNFGAIAYSWDDIFNVSGGAAENINSWQEPNTDNFYFKLDHLSNTIRITGWIGFDSHQIQSFGYIVDGKELYLDSSFIQDAEETVQNAGGKNAKRFVINIPLNLLKEEGSHSIMKAVMLDDGTVCEMGYAINFVVPSVSQTIPELVAQQDAGYVADALDGAWLDEAGIDLGDLSYALEWVSNPGSGHPACVQINGWIGFAQEIDAFGYILDDQIVYDVTLMTETGQDVKNAGGEHASRCSLKANVKNLVVGEHKLQFVVKFVDGTVSTIYDPITIHVLNPDENQPITIFDAEKQKKQAADGNQITEFSDVKTENGFTYIHYVPAFGGGSDPFYYLRGFNAGRYLAIRYRTNATGCNIQYYFGSEGTGPINDVGMLKNPVIADQNWHLMLVDLQPIIDTGLYDGKYASYMRFDFLETGDLGVGPDGTHMKAPIPEGAYLDVEYIAFFGTSERALAYEEKNHPNVLSSPTTVVEEGRPIYIQAVGEGDAWIGINQKGDHAEAIKWIYLKDAGTGLFDIRKVGETGGKYQGTELANLPAGSYEIRLMPVGSLSADQATATLLLTILPGHGENVALGKETVISGIQWRSESWNEAFLNDGFRPKDINLGLTEAEGWMSQGSADIKPAGDSVYAGVNLGAVHAIDEIIIYSRLSGCYFPQAFDVQISTDGVEYKTVYSETANKIVDEYQEVSVKLETPENAQYVRIVARELREPYEGGLGGYLMQIGEIEVYGHTLN